MVILRLYKVSYHLGFSWKIAKRDTLSPLFDKYSLLSLLSTSATLWIAYMLGSEALMEESVSTAKAAVALIMVIPLWFLLNLLLSPFRAFKEIKALGAWKKKEFIYNHPILVKTLHITPENNGDIEEITFNDAEANALVSYKVEYDGGLAYVEIDVHENNFQNTWGLPNREVQIGGIRVGKRKQAKIISRCPPNSATTIVRVYMLGWEI